MFCKSETYLINIRTFAESTEKDCRRIILSYILEDHEIPDTNIGPSNFFPCHSSGIFSNSLIYLNSTLHDAFSKHEKLQDILPYPCQNVRLNISFSELLDKTWKKYFSRNSLNLILFKKKTQTLNNPESSWRNQMCLA